MNDADSRYPETAPVHGDCTTCRHSRPATSQWVFCTWPVPVWLKQITGRDAANGSAYVQIEDGVRCVTWEKKEP